MSLCAALPRPLPVPPEPALSEKHVHGVGGAPGSAPLRKGFGKSRREWFREAHTLTHPSSPAAPGPGYLLEEDESDCHLPFLLFVDYQMLSAVSRTALGWGRGEGGRMEGGRKSQPLSQWGKSVLK